MCQVWIISIYSVVVNRSLILVEEGREESSKCLWWLTVPNLLKKMLYANCYPYCYPYCYANHYPNRYTTVILPLYYRYTTVILPLYYRYTTIILPFHYYSPVKPRSNRFEKPKHEATGKKQQKLSISGMAGAMSSCIGIITTYIWARVMFRMAQVYF